jgi:hypothetical protein
VVDVAAGHEEGRLEHAAIIPTYPTDLMENDDIP